MPNPELPRSFPAAKTGLSRELAVAFAAAFFAAALRGEAEKPRPEDGGTRSPELFSFLRCDAKLPDPKMQPMIDAVCEQMKGP